MLRRFIGIMLILSLTCTFTQFTIGSQPTNALSEPSDPNTMYVATASEPVTVDPAWSYDTASNQLILNVYETLVSFKINRSEPIPTKQLLTDQFSPKLANGWLWSFETPDTFYFEIREGVMFHDGSWLTPWDVEYSFERAMVQDREGGPVWMLYESLLGVYSSGEFNLTDPEQAQELGYKIDNAVEANSTHVWFNLHLPYDDESYVEFMQTLSHPVASVISKAWAVANGDWSGDWGDYTDWVAYNNPSVSPLDLIDLNILPEPSTATCGTGPYRLYYWNKGIEYYLEKFDDYWQDWPSPFAESYVTRVIVQFYPAHEVRTLKLQYGEVDVAYIPKACINLYNLLGTSGVRFIYPLQNTSQPMLSLDALFFNFEVNMYNPYVYVYGTGSDPNNWHEDGIPYDFFSDIYVRKGFAYIFDYVKAIAEVWMGGANRTATPLMAGLYPDLRDPNTSTYGFNESVARTYFQMAWGGLLWEKGFTLPIFYNSGSYESVIIAQILHDVLGYYFFSWQSEYPYLWQYKHFEYCYLNWPVFLAELRNRNMPLFITGWQADHIDPYNSIYPFMHSLGSLAYFQGYWNPYVDELLDGDNSSLPTEERRVTYQELQQYYFLDVPSVPIAQPFGHFFARDWVQGWFYNTIWGGGLTPDHEPPLYFYYLWKSSPQHTLTYSLTIIAGEIGTTNPSPGTYNYMPGAIANITAIPNINYVLDHWELDNPPLNIGGSNSTSIPMYWNHELRAVFRRVYVTHDIAVVNVTSRTIVSQGYTTKVNVTIANEGDYTENFNVVLYANSTVIETRLATLVNGTRTRTYIILTFTWNTASFIKGNYTLSINIAPLPGETDTTDNTLIDGSIYVGIPGDVAPTYGQVDMKDIGTVVKAFGSVPGHPKWSPNCDINCDEKVDMKDVGITVQHFGETEP